MKRIPLTKGQFAIVDDNDFEELSKYKWFASKEYDRFYAGRQIRLNNGRQKMIRMHRQILNLSNPKQFCDHINGNGLDNRRSNLRPCTASENRMNSKVRSDNTTGFKGVCFNKREGKFQANIFTYGKCKHIGYFACPIEAAKAYNAAAVKYHGEFANLNQIPTHD